MGTKARMLLSAAQVSGDDQVVQAVSKSLKNNSLYNMFPACDESMMMWLWSQSSQSGTQGEASYPS